jgi:hypothetical protein
MAGNTQIDPATEGGLFSFMHGLLGYAVFLVLFLAIVGILTGMAIGVQNDNAEKFYSVNPDIHALKMNSLDNIKYRTMQGEK